MSKPESFEERVRTNYNQTGVAVMQAMYSDGYLSMGGVASTDELAQLAGIDETSRVLDIGCGVGGPAVRLAATLGCTVTGIDLIDTSIAQAMSTAAAHGVSDRVSFEVGDATATPFPDASFDVVFSQDAWCHVPDKVALLDECSRVLRPGGRIAFTDWLAGTGMSGAERAAALDAAVSGNAATAERYLAMLEGAGFVDIAYEDISATFVEQYRVIYERLQLDKPRLVEQFGDRVYIIVRNMNGTILRGFEGEAIAGGRFVATKPTDQAG